MPRQRSRLNYSRSSTFGSRSGFSTTSLTCRPARFARRWAQIDPHVLYIEDPHPRAVRDANRPQPLDVVAGLREAFARLEAAESGSRPSLAGVDAVRPVTFGYLPVYRKPQDDAEWNEFSGALATAGELGIDQYERVRDDLIERVIAAKLRRLAAIDPATCSVSDWNSATTLDVLSMHDTMNHTARPDGAICLEREVVDRLPAVVAMSNRGDSNGDVITSDEPTLRGDDGVPTMDPTHLRAIGNAYRIAFDAWGVDDVAYNRPYIQVGTRPRRRGPCCARSNHWLSCDPRVVDRASFVWGLCRTNSSVSSCWVPNRPARSCNPAMTGLLHPSESSGWPRRLRHAHDLVRAWGDSLAS